MKRRDLRGLTLAELLLATAVMAILATAAAGLLSAALQAQRGGQSRSEIRREGSMALERMIDGVRRSTFVLVPNAHAPIRDILAFSGLDNDDGDYYFNDPLFPRIDEDLSWDMVEDGKSGIRGIDDDGDGWTDLSSDDDDDEDTLVAEDPLDGIDNDGDGNVDEDCSWDTNSDGAPGLAGVDDDGDGQIDEGHIGDDDEDGSLDELGLLPVIYTFDPGTSTLSEKHTSSGRTIVLSTRVSSFEVEYLDPWLIRIHLVLEDQNGRRVTFTGRVFPRNTLQKTGKRVR